ncbi:hypothetical protein SUGI_0275150 [Cryptomeria japonica]|nr:hypothetical protein SUGI_0275150 [Cryptomeria japonica]
MKDLGSPTGAVRSIRQSGTVGLASLGGIGGVVEGVEGEWSGGRVEWSGCDGAGWGKEKRQCEMVQCPEGLRLHHSRRRRRGSVCAPNLHNFGGLPLPCGRRCCPIHSGAWR